MSKRSTNLNRGHKSARLSASNLLGLMDALGISAEEQRQITARAAMSPVTVEQAASVAAPTLYRLSYKHRHADPWQETEPMTLREVPLARARLRSQYAIVIKEWQDAHGNWNH